MIAHLSNHFGVSTVEIRKLNYAKVFIYYMFITTISSIIKVFTFYVLFLKFVATCPEISAAEHILELNLELFTWFWQVNSTSSTKFNFLR